MQMFMLMKDYGGRLGMEATVHPERTRSSIVTEARDLLARDEIKIVFVKFIDGNFIEDITQEIIDEALSDIEAEPIDRQALRFDHAMDHRKNYVGV